MYMYIQCTCSFSSYTSVKCTMAALQVYRPLAEDDLEDSMGARGVLVG